jgi:hypothetical protein
LSKKNFQLAHWQQKFVDRFAASTSQRSSLVALPGTGRALTSIQAARKKLRTGKCRRIIVVTDLLVLRKQWQHVASANDLDLSDDLSNKFAHGASITYQSLFDQGRSDS